MKILLYGINYLPELTGIGKYTGEMAEWLTQQGHNVHVVTAPPYYPEWKVSKKYSSIFYRYEIINGVHVWRCPLWVPSRPSGLKRILHLASFSLSSFPIMMSKIFWRPNIILVVEPPLFCAPTTLLTAWFCRARSWLHIQDFEVDAAFDLGFISSKWLRSFFLKIEKKLMSQFDKVSTISEKMIFRLEAKGAQSERQVFFPNWVDIDYIYPLKKSSKLRVQLEIPNSSIVFLYSGNMGKKQGLEIIIDSARRLLGNENIIFVMCGDGSAHRQLRKLAEGLNNIFWLPLRPLDKLNDLLNMADVHLLPQKSDAADLVMPSKLTGMFASGRPVLATAFEGTQIAKVVESSGAGVVVPPENVAAFIKALLDLAEDEALRQLLGKNARNYAVEYLGREVVLKQFNEVLDSCCVNNKLS
ncbi:MAG: glycosyltransferase WbuB [Bacteroidetes bacterium]|nr:glycosyltransferase WbuB [Bacteroidota bacterium]